VYVDVVVVVVVVVAVVEEVVVDNSRISIICSSYLFSIVFKFCTIIVAVVIVINISINYKYYSLLFSFF
jgi:hypothetical protein